MISGDNYYCYLKSLLIDFYPIPFPSKQYQNFADCSVLNGLSSFNNPMRATTWMKKQKRVK